MAFDRPIPAIETAGAAVAEAAETAASEAVFARCVFAQMFTPPDFRASLFRFKPHSPPPRRRTHGAGPSAVSHTNRRRPRRTIGPLPCAPRLPRRPSLAGRPRPQGLWSRLTTMELHRPRRTWPPGRETHTRRINDDSHSQTPTPDPVRRPGRAGLVRHRAGPVLHRHAAGGSAGRLRPR